ncbi:cytochrome P450 307a1 [Drosophila tropicalis]|uniref:cytochrome P450 307a1 n=1 Tax=Drosophila tropicalis TaxID=46794 RepID=UPI0035AB8F21
MFLAALLLCVVVVIVSSYITILYKAKRKVLVTIRQINQHYNQAPGPKPWPIIGNLDILSRYQHNPFEGFTKLTREYGDIYSLTLGHTRCLVVNNLDLIREVLNQNGRFISGRPDFLRYHKLFGGDRANSLALCDWSQLQQKRRNLARRYCSPRESSSNFNQISDIGCQEMNELVKELDQKLDEAIDLKPLILKACANMFSIYMCSQRFEYSDQDFQLMVKYFDEIFWEINQGHPLDFLPWLQPFYLGHLKKIVNWSTTIRQIIMERIIHGREMNVDLDTDDDGDFTDALLRSLREDSEVSRNTIIFMLEDFLGGHSAVGNLVMITLGYIAKNPSIARHIQEEVDAISSNGQRNIQLSDMSQMPYIMATIFEVLRYSSSPIVPHVATENALIAGFGVPKGSIVFINNYKLNTSTENWSKPEEFEPKRFLEEANTKRCSIDSDSGIETIKEVKLKKNIPHFLPFSIGKRTCIGQNLLRAYAFLLLTNIMGRYDVDGRNLTEIQMNSASLALPAKCFPLILRRRSS